VNRQLASRAVNRSTSGNWAPEHRHNHLGTCIPIRQIVAFALLWVPVPVRPQKRPLGGSRVVDAAVLVVFHEYGSGFGRHSVVTFPTRVHIPARPPANLFAGPSVLPVADNLTVVVVDVVVVDDEDCSLLCLYSMSTHQIGDDDFAPFSMLPAAADSSTIGRDDCVARFRQGTFYTHPRDFYFRRRYERVMHCGHPDRTRGDHDYGCRCYVESSRRVVDPVEYFARRPRGCSHYHGANDGGRNDVHPKNSHRGPAHLDREEIIMLAVAAVSVVVRPIRKNGSWKLGEHVARQTSRDSPRETSSGR